MGVFAEWLAVVEAAPDSQRAVDTLAAQVTEAAQQDPVGAAELAELVDRVQAEAPANVVNFVNTVRDNANVGRIIQVTGDFYEGGNQ